MNRMISATLIVLSVALAGPAAAFSVPINFPTLTFPEPPAPDVSKDCTDVTTLSGQTCTSPSKWPQLRQGSIPPEPCRASRLPEMN